MSSPFMQPRRLRSVMRRLLGVLTAIAAAATFMAVPAAGVAGFGDVEGDAYWAEAVQWMVDNDLTTGTSPTCFSPSAPVTRGQAAAFMWRMAGEPNPASRHPFLDVVSGWQHDAVSWMVERGVTTGTAPRLYSPNDALTRGQLAALLHRLDGEPAGGGHPFNDVVRSWQQAPIAWMVAQGITTGTSSSTFSPDDIVTRGQLATFFYRYKGSPSVAVSAASPSCDGPNPSGPTTNPPGSTTPGSTTPGSTTPPVNCNVRADQPWSPVWFDIHYNDGASVCARPRFVGTGQTYIVDRNHWSASDSNAGTAASPWLTIAHAASIADAGDIVYVKAGTYVQERVELLESGVIFSAFPGQERDVTLVGGGFRARRISDLIIHGFSLRNITRSGISVSGPDASNIVIANNHTYDTWNSGINVTGVPADYDPGDFDNLRDTLVIGNLVQLGTNGGLGEIISVNNGVVRVHVVANEVSIGDSGDTGGDEGISFKEGVRDSKIYGNVVHDLVDKGIHIEGGRNTWNSLITDIEIYDNRLFNLPSHGMWVTTEGVGDVDGVYVHDNYAWNNDANGFHVYNHPDGAAAGGTVKNIVFEHNVAFNNGTHGGYGGFRVHHSTATGIVFRNNIGWGNTGQDIRGEAETTIEHNLCRETDRCEVTSNPRFVNAPSNFGLASGSPAIGAASNGGNLGPR
jgi:hypothetical protein